MSLFKGFMGDFDDDPFFGSQMSPMHQMSSMMNSMLADPFGMFGFGGSGRRGHGGNSRDLMPFGFPNINDIFNNFQMNTNDPNCHSYSSSTIMTMSSGPDGRPQVYQASQSTRTAPGGIRETKKSVCDSRTGTKKLAIGHHIGDRSHVLEREKNLISGEEEERQEFINLDEEEADQFNQEWESKARGSANAIGYGQPRMRGRHQRDDIPAILDRYRPRPRITARRHYYPALPSTSSSQSSKTEEEEDEEEEEETEQPEKSDKTDKPEKTEKPQKGKKRSQLEDGSSDEEEKEEYSGRKSHKLLKSSNKRKH